MKAEYKKDLMHSYMILTDIGEAEETYPLNVLLTNRIRGILPLTVEHLNNETGCRYEITGLQPFSLYCERVKQNVVSLKQIYMGLLDSLDEFEDYLLDPGHLLLDPEYLFIRWETGELNIPYLPAENQEISRSLKELTEYLLTHVGHSNHDCVVLLCNILHELEKPNSQIADLRMIFGSESGQLNSGLFEDIDEEEPMYRYPKGISSNSGHIEGQEIHSAGRNQRERAGSFGFSFPEAGYGGENHREEVPSGQSGMSSSAEFPEGRSNLRDYDSVDSERGMKEFGNNGFPEDGNEKKPKKHRFLPDRDVLLSAAGMLATVCAVWIGINIQTAFGFDLTEKAGLCLLGASVFCLLARLIIHKRNAGEGIEMSENTEESLKLNDYMIYPDEPVLDYGLNQLNAAKDIFGDRVDYQFDEGNQKTGKTRRTGVKEGSIQSGMGDFAAAYPGRGLYQNPDPYVNDEAGRYEHFSGSETVRNDDTVLLGEPGTMSRIPASFVPVCSDGDLVPFSIDSDDVLIGHKDAMVDRVIRDNSVSRLHARVFRKDGSWFLADMGSTNGTTMNGRPVVGREEVELTEGARVRFARCEYLFHTGT